MKASNQSLYEEFTSLVNALYGCGEDCVEALEAREKGVIPDLYKARPVRVVDPFNDGAKYPVSPEWVYRNREQYRLFLRFAEVCPDWHDHVSTSLDASGLDWEAIEQAVDIALTHIERYRAQLKADAPVTDGKPKKVSEPVKKRLIG